MRTSSGMMMLDTPKKQRPCKSTLNSHQPQLFEKNKRLQIPVTSMCFDAILGSKCSTKAREDYRLLGADWVQKPYRLEG